MNHIAGNKTKRNLVIFSFISLTIGWIGVFIDTLIPDQPKGNTMGMGIWLITPLITALLLRTFAGDRWNDTGFLPGFKRNIKWYVLSFFIFPVLIFVVISIGSLLKWIDISSFSTGSFFPVFIGSLLPLLIKNFFEESIWRGYLTSKLLTLKTNDFQLYLFVSLVWGFWHLPYNLIFLPYSDIQMVLPGSRFQFIFINFISIVFLSVLYTEIYRAAKSIWPTVILHTISNALVNTLLLDGFIKISQGKELLISPAIGIIPIVLYFIFALLLRKHRIKMQRTSPSSGHV